MAKYLSFISVINFIIVIDLGMAPDYSKTKHKSFYGNEMFASINLRNYWQNVLWELVKNRILGSCNSLNKIILKPCPKLKQQFRHAIGSQQGRHTVGAGDRLGCWC